MAYILIGLTAFFALITLGLYIIPAYFIIAEKVRK